MAQPAHAQSFLAPRATSISSVVVQAANGSPAGLSSRHNGRQQQGSPNEPPRFCTTLFNFADWTARPEAASTAMPADDSVELPLKPSSGLGEPRPTAETSAAESEPQLRPDSNQGHPWVLVLFTGTASPFTVFRPALLRQTERRKFSLLIARHGNLSRFLCAAAVTTAVPGRCQIFNAFSLSIVRCIRISQWP